MEDKNLASEMLHRMKKYKRSDDGAEEAASREDAPSGPSFDEKDVKKEPETRAIPQDESLFEFDDATFEEAKYTEELSEKFGFSKEIGVGFIDDGEEPAENVEQESADSDVSEPVESEAVAEEAEAESFESEIKETITEAELERKVGRLVSGAPTPTGVQMTFLDSGDEEENEDVKFDEATEPEEQQEDAEPEIEDITVINIEDSAADEAEEQAAKEYIDEPEEIELTPIELAAIGQGELFEEEPEEAEPVTEATNDLWDSKGRAQMEAKKKFLDYCDSLTVPPLKTTRDSRKKSSEEGPCESAYKYATNERMPLFADGMHGGKNTESYRQREIEYCEKREKKRAGMLLDRLRLMTKKVIGLFVIMMMVIIIENINMIIDSPNYGVSGGNVILFGILEAILLSFGLVIIGDSVIDGIKSVLKGVFIPEFMVVLVTVPAIIYHLIIAIAGHGSQYAIMFGTGAAVAMFLCGIYRYNMLRRDYITFSVASSYGDYVTEVRMSDLKNTAEGKAFDKYAAPDTELYKLNKVSRIDAVYEDVPVRDECYGVIRNICLGMVCAAVAVGVIFGIIKNDALYGLASAISLMSFAAPISVFITLSLPRLRSANVSAEYGGAVVDFDDESDDFVASIVMIDDGELFPPENLVSSGFEMQRSPDIEQHLARSLSLFKKIGGSLAAVFSNVGETLIASNDITVTEISDGGIAAMIDGKEICAGNEAYMDMRGISIKRYEKLLPINGRVMYIADDGKFFARVVLTFTPSAPLIKKMAALRNTETMFSLKSCNPCIDSELLFYTTGLEPDLLRLVKYDVVDDVTPSETDREGCLVSKNGAVGLVTALLEYERQKKLTYTSAKFACLACGVGAAVSLVISIIGIRFGYASLLAALTHGVLAIIASFTAFRSAIKTRKSQKKKK